MLIFIFIYTRNLRGRELEKIRLGKLKEEELEVY
jgi:hypothetical protein